MTETIKLICAVLITALIILGGRKVLDWRDKAIQSEEQTRTMQSTSGIVKAGGEAAKDRGRVQGAVNQAREQFDTQIQEDSKHEPETLARGNMLVPTSRLHAFRERRLARERFGCAASHCVPGDKASDPSKR